jgi:hypothetical protein
MTKQLTTFLLTLFFFSTSCSDDEKKEFKATRFVEDRQNFSLEQTFNSPNSNGFLAIMQGEGEYSFTSGAKILKLYSTDSISKGEVHFSAHPLRITKWDSKGIYLAAKINSTKKDSAYSSWYLNNSVDQNKTIGGIKLHYHKTLNIGQE